MFFKKFLPSFMLANSSHYLNKYSMAFRAALASFLLTLVLMFTASAAQAQTPCVDCCCPQAACIALPPPCPYCGDAICDNAFGVPIDQGTLSMLLLGVAYGARAVSRRRKRGPKA